MLSKSYLLDFLDVLYLPNKPKTLSTLILLFGNDKLLALFDELNGYEPYRENQVFVSFVKWFVWTYPKGYRGHGFE